MTHIFGVRVEALFPIAVLVVLSLAASVEAVVYVPQSSRGVLVMTDPRYGYAREETFYADRVIDTIQALEDMGYIVQTEPMPSFPTDVDNFLSRLDQFDRLVITAPRIFWAYTLAYNWNYAYGAYGSSQYYYYSASRDLVKGIISWVEDCNVLIHFGGLQGDLFFSVLAREIYNMPFVRGFNYDDPVLNATSAARQDPNFPGVNGFPYPYGTEKTEAVVSRGISQVLSVQGRDGYYLDSYECLFNLRDYYYVIPSRSVDGDNRPPFAQEMCADMRMSIGGGTMFWFGQTFYDYDYRSNDNNQFESFRDMLEVALQTDIDCDEGSVSIDPPVVGKALVMANPEAGPYRYRGIGGQTLFDSDTLLDAIIHTLNLNYEVEIRDAPSFPHDVPAFLEELYESALLLVDQPRVFWMDSLRRTYSYYASYETYTGPYGNDLGDYYSAQFDFNTGILDWISQCGGTMISLGGENGAEAVLGDFVNNYYGQSYTWFDYYLSGTINYRYSYSYATLAASPDFSYKGILRNTLYTSEVFFDPSPWQNITCIFSPYFNEEIDGPLPPINDKEARPTRSSRSADNYEDDGCTDILIEIGRGKLYFFGQLFADYGYGRDLFYSSRGEFNQYYDLESIMGIAFTDTNFDSPCNPNEPTTPTPSPTASQTTSTTPTPSTSLTATPSRTGTRSPSVTPPSTPTSSPAQTPQGTVSAGGTASATMTLTASPSHTPSSTASPSESSSSTSSPSFSSTQTPSASVSPSMSGTSSVTPSHTSTGTPTPSETPSISDTATPSRTRSATRSSSPTRAPPSSSPSHTRSPDGISKTPTVSQTPVPTPFPTRTPGDEEGSNPPNPVEGPSAPSASPSRSPSPSPSMTILPTPEPEREKCGQIPSYAVQEQVVELTGREQLITIFSEDCSALGDVTIPSGFDGSIKVEQGFINSRCKSIITPMVNLTMITPNGEELATFDFEDHVKICLESFAFVDVDDTCMAFYVGEADDWRCVPFNTQKDATSRYCSVTTHFTSFAVLLTANDGGDSSNDNAFDSTYGWLSLGAVLLAVLIILAVIFVYDIRFRRKRALLNKSLTVHGDTAALISSGSKAPSSSSSSSV